ncbi:metallophosphoesterase [Phycisphaerales bacterium AB-hyl4]|uniref:Metallophosphoesterase n=1 Tax=Natronomicrosphaera hydrolytica TaxID=3242702 RepID=A0ABV4U3F1_9BACT
MTMTNPADLSRRAFLKGSTTALLGASFLGGLPITRAHAAAAAARSNAAWSFGLLGDLHYDLWEHHDMDWVKREKPNDIRQIEGYVRFTTEILPHLGTELRDVIAATPNDVDYVINIGDFVEGLCGSYELQVKQFEDALDWVRESQWGAPYLITKGNHDITGPGADEAFDDCMLPFMSEQVGRQLDSANFVVEHKNALFVYLDCYDRRQILPWLSETLEKHTGQHEHIFVVTHQPVVPYHARANWTVFGHPNQADDRKQFLDLLGKHHVIALTGHLHRYGFVRRRTDTGHFIELAVNSIVRSPDSRPRQVWEGVSEYGPDIVTLEPRFSPDTEEMRREILANEQPHIEHFECGNVEGYGMVHVDGSQVSADLYYGLGKNHWRTLDLTAVLHAKGPTPFDVTT